MINYHYHQTLFVLDFLIASTAISQGAVLVSNDGIFGDIVEYGFGLDFEEWV